MQQRIQQLALPKNSNGCISVCRVLTGAKTRILAVGVLTSQ
jgi:hypothetical protein